MAIEYISGDPLQTTAHVLYFGMNVQGRIESGKFETALHTRFPAAFSGFSRQCQAQKIKPGMVWYWRDAQPALGFMVIRESPFGATRLRYVDAVLLSLARDHQRQGVTSAAIVLPRSEPDEIKQMIGRWLGKLALPVTVYEGV